MMCQGLNSVMSHLSCALFVCASALLVKLAQLADVLPKTVVHVYGEEHFLKECSFDSASVKAVYPSLKAPIYQLLEHPLFVLAKTSGDRANAVFLPEGLTKPVTTPPVHPSIDVMLRSYEDRHSLVFSLAHFPFKHFKDLTLNDFLSNARTLQNVPLTDIPVMAFYTKNELDELKSFFKFFYMGDLEVTSNAVTSNRKSSDLTPPGYPKSVNSSSSMSMVGYPFVNRLPSNHPQKQAFFLAPVPVIVPKQSPVLGVHNDDDNLNHNILNRSPPVTHERSPSVRDHQAHSRNYPPSHKSAADLPVVYSYRGVPLYVPKSASAGHSTDGPLPYSLPSSISSTESAESVMVGTTESSVNGPQPYSLPAGVGGTENGPDTAGGGGAFPQQQEVSLVFPSSPRPYSLPAGYVGGGIDQ